MDGTDLCIDYQKSLLSPFPCVIFIQLYGAGAESGELRTKVGGAQLCPAHLRLQYPVSGDSSVCATPRWSPCSMSSVLPWPYLQPQEIHRYLDIYYLQSTYLYYLLSTVHISTSYSPYIYYLQSTYLLSTVHISTIYSPHIYLYSPHIPLSFAPRPFSPLSGDTNTRYLDYRYST